jgi:hypothetical protein
MATGIVGSTVSRWRSPRPELVVAPDAGVHTQFLVKAKDSAQYFWTLNPGQVVSVMARALVREGKAVSVEVAKNNPFRVGTISYAIGVGNTVKIEWVDNIPTHSEW